MDPVREADVCVGDKTHHKQGVSFIDIPLSTYQELIDDGILNALACAQARHTRKSCCQAMLKSPIDHSTTLPYMHISLHPSDLRADTEPAAERTTCSVKRE